MFLKLNSCLDSVNSYSTYEKGDKESMSCSLPSEGVFKQDTAQSGNQFGPMFKDRDHFNQMHFA